MTCGCKAKTQFDAVYFGHFEDERNPAYAMHVPGSDSTSPIIPCTSLHAASVPLSTPATRCADLSGKAPLTQLCMKTYVCYLQCEKLPETE